MEPFLPPPTAGPVYRSRNMGALVLIHNKKAGVRIIADLPAQISIGNQSSYTQYNGVVPRNLLAGSTLGEIGQQAGGNVLLQSYTHLVWVDSQPTQFSMQLMLNAETNSYDDVHRIGAQLNMLVMPDLSNGILFPPRGLGSGNKTSIRIGRQYFFDDVVVHSASLTTDTRIDADGYPIHGIIDMHVSTARVLSRQDWRQISSIETNTVGRVSQDFTP